MSACGRAIALLPAGFPSLLSGCPVAEPTEEPTLPDYGDDDTVSDDDDAIPSGPAPFAFEPEDGTTGNAATGVVWVDFTEEIETAVITLSAAGAEIAGGSFHGGAARIVFVPDDPLPDGVIEGRITWDDRALDWSFTVTRATDWVDGGPFALDLVGGRSAGPVGGEAFLPNLPLSVLVGFDGADMLGGFSAQGVEPLAQDRCSPTFASALRRDGPYVAVGPFDLRPTVDLAILGYGRTPMHLTGARLLGRLDEAGLLRDVAFAAEIDAREINLPDACSLLESVGLSCARCAGELDPLARACLYLALDQIESVAWDGTLEGRPLDVIASDPACLPAEGP